MNLLVIGGGRTGIFWAVVCARAGFEVTLLVRPGQLNRFSSNNPPTIEWVGDKSIYWQGETIYVTSNLTNINRDKEWYILPAVRSYALPTAMQPLVTLLQKKLKGVIIPTNGFAGELAAVKNISADKIASTTLTLPCEMHPNRRNCTQVMNPHGGIGVAPYRPSRPVQNAQTTTANIFAAALETVQGITICRYDNWLSMKYTKLLLNFLGNTLPALLGSNVENAYEDLRVCRTELRLVCETLHVRKYLEVDLVSLPNYPSSKLRPLLFLAKLERLLGWSYVPARLYQQVVVPKIQTARGGKTPSLLTEIRGLSDSLEPGYCENLHLDLVKMLDKQPARKAPLTFRVGRLLNECFRQRETRERIFKNPDRLMNELRQ